jgi:hypothetical protein
MFSIRTIGPGWSEDPEERRRQVAEQEAAVSVAALADEMILAWELEEAAERLRRERRDVEVDGQDRVRHDPE